MSDTRKELEQKIIERAMKDEAFRNKLKTDPKAAIEETLGVKLPGNVNVYVNSESDTDIHITLPAQTGEMKEGELSGEQLAGVSGGWNVCEYSGGM